MKKQYLKPEWEIFDFAAEQMIAQSVTDPEKDDVPWTDEEEEAGTNKFKHDWGSSKWSDSISVYS